MQVTFKSSQIIGNRPYNAGTQLVADHLARNQRFKQLVRAGVIIVLVKDANAQKMQMAKDAQNAKKSEIARQLTQQLKEARENGVHPLNVAEAAKPGVGQKLLDKLDVKIQKNAKKPDVVAHLAGIRTKVSDIMAQKATKKAPAVPVAQVPAKAPTSDKATT